MENEEWKQGWESGCQAGKMLLADYRLKITKLIEEMKKGVCCPEATYHDDYCCMEVRGYNQALTELKEKLNPQD